MWPKESSYFAVWPDCAICHPIRRFRLVDALIFLPDLGNFHLTLLLPHFLAQLVRTLELHLGKKFWHLFLNLANLLSKYLVTLASCHFCVIFGLLFTQNIRSLWNLATFIAFLGETSTHSGLFGKFWATFLLQNIRAHWTSNPFHEEKYFFRSLKQMG